MASSNGLAGPHQCLTISGTLCRNTDWIFLGANRTGHPNLAKFAHAEGSGSDGHWPLAGIISTTGAIETISNPPNVTLNQLESNDHLFLFPERQGVTLSQNLAVGITQAGSITFDRPVLGITVGLIGYQKVNGPGNTLDLSDGPLGLPGTVYGFNPVDLTPGVVGSDTLTLSPDRRTVSMRLSTGEDSDNMRIVTAASVPEPATVMLVPVLAVALVRRREVHL